MPSFWVKLGADDLNCVDVPFTQSRRVWRASQSMAVGENRLSVHICCRQFKLRLNVLRSSTELQLYDSH